MASRAEGRAKLPLVLTSFFQETCNKPALRRLKLSEDLLLYFYTCDAPPPPRPALPLLAMADQQEAPALTQGDQKVFLLKNHSVFVNF